MRISRKLIKFTRLILSWKPLPLVVYKMPLFVRKSRHYWMKRYLVDAKVFVRIFKTWKRR